MSERVDHQDIWDPKLWDTTEVLNYKKALEATDEALVDIAKHGKQIVETIDFKNLKEIQKVNKEFEKSNKVFSVAETNAKNRLKLEQRLEVANSKKASQNAVINEQIKVQNKLNRDLAKESLGLVSAYQKESKQLNDLRNKFKDLAVQEKQNTKEGRALLKNITRLDTKLKRIDKTVGQSQRSVGDYGIAVRKLGTGLKRLAGRFGLIGGIALFTRAIRNSFQKIVQFQKANADLAGVLGKTRKEIGKLTSDAKRLGSQTKFTASQVTGLQKEFAKLGFSSEEILNVTEATLTLATATSTELPRAAEVVGNTLRAFQLDTSETQRVVDLMTKSFNVSALDMERFSTAMSSVAPVARTAGFSIERTTAVLGTLASNGIDASTAGTALRNIFLELSKSGKTFEEAMVEINTATDKNAKALELFGKRGAAVASIIADNTDSIEEMNIALLNAGGTAEKVADEQMNTLQGQMDEMASAWEGFIFSLESGDGVISSVIGNAISLVTDLLGALTALNTTQQQTIEQSSQLGISAAVEEANKSVSSLNRAFELLNKSNEELIDGQDKFRKGIENAVVITGKDLDLTKLILKLRKEENDELTIKEKLALFSVTTAERESGLNRANIEEARKQNEELRKTNIEKVKALEEQFGLQLKINNAGNTIIETIKRGPLAILDNDEIKGNVKNAEEARAEILKLNKEVAESENNFALLEKTLIGAGNALRTQFEKESIEELQRQLKRNLPEFEKDLIKIVIANKELEKSQNDVSKSGAKSAKQDKRKTEEQLNRLEQLKKDLKEVQQQREDNFSKNKDLDNESFKLLTRNAEGIKQEIELIEELIDLKLKKIDLEKEDKETIDDRIASSLDASKKSLDAQKKAEEDRIKSEEDRKKREEELRRERLNSIAEETRAIINALEERSQAREEDINEELSKAQERESELKRIAREGQLDAAESIAAERRKIADLQRQELEEQKRQERLKLGLAALDLLVANIERGSEDPTGETGRQMLNLVSLINALPAFYEGTEDTGKGGSVDGKGGFHAILHPNERVMTKAQNEELGGKSNKDIVNIVKQYDQTLFPAGAIKTPAIEVKPFMSNEAVLEKFDSLESQMRANTKAIQDKPVQWFELDHLTGHVVECIQVGNKIKRIHHEKKINF